MKFKRWYFGHHYVDLDIGKYSCLYNRIVRLGEKDNVAQKERNNMQTRFFADDGTEFESASECQAYERDIALQKYYAEFVEPSLADRANHIIKLFQAECRSRRVEDDLLESEGNCARYTGDVASMGVYSPGVVHVRDDLVDILIMRIRELEGKPVYNVRMA